MDTEPVPCTTEGCTTIKFFAGRCNPCQSAWEAVNPIPISDPYRGLSWSEEMAARCREASIARHPHCKVAGIEH
jgi:hypothetical protein